MRTKVSLIKDQNFCMSAEDDMVTKFAKFAIERHKIYLKKTVLSKEKPWTSDPILRSNRFCNIYRELDTVSIWIRDHIIEPYEDNPNLWFMLCIARLINWPPTLQMIMANDLWPEDTWNADKVYEVMADWYESGHKTITSAYLINSVPPKDLDVPDTRKVYYIPKIGLDPLWKDRKRIRNQFKTSLKEAVNTLGSYHGWGQFMSYQVVVDLTYSKRWLINAPDYNTFNSPGPGTKRGLSRYFTGGIDGGLNKKDLNGLIIRQREEVNAKMRELVPDKWWTDDFETGFQDLSLSNMSNLNCESDKYLRVFQGESKMRSKYPGVK